MWEGRDGRSAARAAHRHVGERYSQNPFTAHKGKACLCNNRGLFLTWVILVHAWGFTVRLSEAKMPLLVLRDRSRGIKARPWWCLIFHPLCNPDQHISFSNHYNSLAFTHTHIHTHPLSHPLFHFHTCLAPAQVTHRTGPDGGCAAAHLAFTSASALRTEGSAGTSQCLRLLTFFTQLSTERERQRKKYRGGEQ